MSKLVGYARISTKDQDLRSQIDSLIKNGCNESDIYTDIIPHEILTTVLRI